MNLQEFGQQLAKFGLPLLGAALPIPGGAVLGQALATYIGSPTSTPNDILATLGASADAIEKAKEFELNNQSALFKTKIDYEVAMRTADSTDIANVNTTIQAEDTNSVNEAWYQKAWRPYNGFIVGTGSLFSVVFTCYLFYVALTTKDTASLSIIPQLASSIALILGIPGAAVGISAYGRNQLKVAQLGVSNGNNASSNSV